MKLVLDTHALLWWLSDDLRLGEPARDLVADPANDVLIAVACLWENLAKIRAGKLTAIQDILDDPSHELRIAIPRGGLTTEAGQNRQSHRSLPVR